MRLIALIIGCTCVFLVIITTLIMATDTLPNMSFYRAIAAPAIAVGILAGATLHILSGGCK